MIVKKYKGNKVSVTLQRARDLIKDPKNWTQKAYARTKSGDRVLASNPNAERFCALGALKAVDGPKQMDAEHALNMSTGNDKYLFASIIGINDGGSRRESHEKVLAVYDKAIKRAREKERNASKANN